MAFGEMVEAVGAIDDAACHQVDDIFLAALDYALDPHQPRCHHRAALFFHIARPKERVDHAGLVLDRDEHGIALARPLADEDDKRFKQLLDAYNQRVNDESWTPDPGDFLHDRWLVVRRGKRNFAGIELVV